MRTGCAVVVVRAMCAYTEEKPPHEAADLGKKRGNEIRKRFLSEKMRRRKSAESTPVLHTYPSRVLSNHDDVFVHNPFRNFVSGNLQI